MNVRNSIRIRCVRPRTGGERGAEGLTGGDRPRTLGMGNINPSSASHLVLEDGLSLFIITYMSEKSHTTVVSQSASLQSGVYLCYVHTVLHYFHFGHQAYIGCIYIPTTPASLTLINILKSFFSYPFE